MADWTYGFWSGACVALAIVVFIGMWVLILWPDSDSGPDEGKDDSVPDYPPPWLMEDSVERWNG